MSSAARDLEVNAQRAGANIGKRAARVEDYLAKLDAGSGFRFGRPSARRPRQGRGGAPGAPRPPRLTIVSCDPATLARDVAALGQLQDRTANAGRSFPQTYHLETVAQLVHAEPTRACGSGGAVRRHSFRAAAADCFYGAQYYGTALCSGVGRSGGGGDTVLPLPSGSPEKKPQIGDYINPNLETIASLRPDLVVVQSNPVRLAERLQTMHLHTLEVDQQNLAAVYETIRVIGDATGTEARAAELTESIRKGLEDIRKRAAALKPVRMMFVIGRSPGRLDGLVVVGKMSISMEAIKAAGARMFFMTPPPRIPKCRWRSLARNPEVIIDMGDMADTDGVSEQHKREVIALWQRRPTIAAVKQHRVFPVALDIFVVPGPRVVDAARAIFILMLHGENH